MSKEPWPACEIFGLHIVEEGERYGYYGSLFCASGQCPDEGKIPAGCECKCLIARSESTILTMAPEYCPIELAMRCPCARPANPYRWACFENWRQNKCEKSQRAFGYIKRRVTGVSHEL